MREGKKRECSSRVRKKGVSLREKENNRVGACGKWKDCRRICTNINKTANARLWHRFFPSLPRLARSHKAAAWILSALNNTKLFILDFIPVISADRRGHSLSLSQSLMHYKYPITTCWLALRGLLAWWWTTLQTKLINGIIVGHTSGQAARTDWVISPHHAAPGLFLNPVWWLTIYCDQTQLG